MLFPFLVALLVMVTVTLLVYGLSQGVGSGQRILTRRLERIREGAGPPTPTGPTPAYLRGKDPGKLGPFAKLLGTSRGVESAALELDRAAIPLRVGEYMVLRFAMAAIFLLMTFILTKMIYIAVPLGIIGYFLPRWYVRSRRKWRQARMNAQLVEMLGLVANSLRSGYGLMQGFEFASKQLAPPLGAEIKRMLQETSLGVNADVALQNLGERVSSPDMEMIITAVTIQRTVGGNLAQLLDGVSYTMRERERIRGDIKTLTSQQRMTGMIIGALPILMGLLFLAINPDYMGVLFTDTVGRVFVVVAALLEMMGIFSIRAMLALDV
jgi:tight adherence protein B